MSAWFLDSELSTCSPLHYKNVSYRYMQYPYIHSQVKPMHVRMHAHTPMHAHTCTHIHTHTCTSKENILINHECTGLWSTNIMYVLEIDT